MDRFGCKSSLPVLIPCSLLLSFDYADVVLVTAAAFLQNRRSPTKVKRQALFLTIQARGLVLLSIAYVVLLFFGNYPYYHAYEQVPVLAEEGITYNPDSSGNDQEREKRDVPIPEVIHASWSFFGLLCFLGAIGLSMARRVLSKKLQPKFKSLSDGSKGTFKSNRPNSHL